MAFHHHRPPPLQHSPQGATWGYPDLTASTSSHPHNPVQEEQLQTFAQTLRDQDEKFYAVFPQAKPTSNQWMYDQLHYDGAFHGSGFHYDPQSPASSSDLQYLHYPDPLHQDVTPSTRPFTLHYDYDYESSTYGSPEHYSQPDHTSDDQQATSPSPHGHAEHFTQPVIDNTSGFVVPTQQRPLERRHSHQASAIEQPFMDHLPSPASPHDMSDVAPSPPSYMDSAPPPLGTPYPYPVPRPDFEQTPSGHWPTQEVRAPAPRYPISSPSESGAEPVDVGPSSSTRRHHSTYRLRRQARSHVAHPHPHPVRIPFPGMRRSTSPRLSPSPSSKRALDKKPPLACLFCRGRKIACGPPSPGSKDKTCNQCERRSLKCEYPLESRRGMRKKKSSINMSGPKVTIAKASPKR